MIRGFLRAGHLPTLVAAFLYFDASFMVWVILGPLAVFIAKDLQLSPAQKGLMVATPILAGAALRIVNGVLADHLKPRRTGIIMQVVVIAGLAAFWVAGAGNSGTVLAALFAPSLAALVGWRNVLGLAIVPLAIVLALFVWLAKD